MKRARRSAAVALAWACALGALGACAKGKAPEPAAAEPAAPAAVNPPAAPVTPAAANEQFGAPIDPATPQVALAELIKDPAAHAGKTVRTEGKIQQVCERMGCWMELADDNAGALRVPMAGHSFFLPQSVRGKRASVQGTLQVSKLSAAQKEHLESEGAKATASEVSLAATGVAVR